MAFAQQDAERFFEQHIRPLLIEECLQCHGPKKQEAGLRIDSRDALLKGGDSGPALEQRQLGDSLLLEAIHYDSFEMPPSGKLPEEKIRLIEEWVNAGAPWPDDAAPLRASTDISEEDRQWWAFRPLVPVTPPVSHDGDWSSTEIDQFVLAEMHEHGLLPAPAADRVTLARRLFLDIVGVPPSPEELDAFMADESPDAWEKLVDRLLADQRYGEHWARFWLDLVRYSESDGWNQDAYRPHIWRYRDYVVRSFNDDKPYPQFVKEQLAGDEIGADNPDHLIATGFLRLGIYEYNQRDARGHWNDIMNEMTDVAGDVFFGMSMACARCHDHKFDPLLQTDYFQLRAFFEPVEWRDDLVAATQAEQQRYQEELSKWEQASSEVQAEIDSLLAPYYTKKWKSTVDKFPLDIQACFNMPVADRTSWQHQMAYLVSRQFMEEGGGPLKSMAADDKKRHEELKAQLAEFDQLKPKPLPKIMAATDFAGIPSPTIIPDSSDQTPIQPGFPQVLSAVSIDDRGDAAGATLPTMATGASSGRRLALAEWITSPRNPLTTRVIVNRIWQQHFGRGLAPTPSDFGRQGVAPSHPELLDWLAQSFVQGGWKFKALHKRIVMSSVWQQSAIHPDAQRQQSIDPDERFLWRAPVRRLTAEQIRDSLLAASGELKTEVGGPSVAETTPRRSLYVKSFRNKNDSFMHGFDIANGLKSVSVRDSTTTPTQALLMINGDYVLGRAQQMAKRLLASGEQDNAELTRQAFLVAWNREPDSAMLQRAMEFFDLPSGEDEYRLSEEQLTDFCHVLINANQFLYVE